MANAAPSPELESAKSFVESNRDHYRDQLFELLRIPSVSSDSTKVDAMAAAAEKVRGLMADAGLEVEILPTNGFPIVYGERKGDGDGPTLLVYGHYDVQPAEPLGPWRHDPFEPTVEGDNVIARGATDDKGQALALLFGVHAAIEKGVGRDVTVKFIIEGEEEVGSSSLEPFIRAERERLAADVVIIADSSQFGPDMPAITYGLRGIACLELIVRGASRDLHSGSYGGAVANPANVLARLVTACQGPFGRIAIPGFYDRVADLSEDERADLHALPFDEARYGESLGVPKLFGEEGYTSLERQWARPTFDVNGLVSGHTGEGMKTVLPCEARAKISMRLVPDQDPDEIARLTREFILSLVPDSVTAEVELYHGARPVVVDRSLDIMSAARAALAFGFGREPVFIREGGSIPVVNTFREALGVDSLLVGLGQPDDGAHGPNEKFSLRDFERGMATMAALMERVGS